MTDKQLDELIKAAQDTHYIIRLSAYSCDGLIHSNAEQLFKNLVKLI